MEGKRKTGHKIKSHDAEVPWLCSFRVGLAVIGFWGCTLLAALRYNLSMAIVCMVNHTAVRETSHDSTQLNSNISDVSHCVNHISNSNTEDGEFLWDKESQGIYLSAFYWGYIVTPILGGKLAERFGGKWVIGISFFITSFVTLFIPFSTRISSWLLVAIRIIQGMGQGAVLPAFQALWTVWAPPLERSKLIGFSYAGLVFGTIVTLPITGALCGLEIDGGWPWIFYISGALGLIWSVVWMILVYDYPDCHPRISDAERDYIIRATTFSKANSGKLGTPWRSLLSSLPVWAGIICLMCSDWMFYTLSTNIPTYLHEIQKLNFEQNGLVSALPFVAFWFVINLSSYLADVMRKRGCSTSITRKLMQTIGAVIPAALLIGMVYVDCTQQTLAIALLVIATGISGCYFTGVIVNLGEVAPPFAGTIFGMANTLSALSGILAPYTVGAITKDQTLYQWRTVFYISTALCVSGTVFFVLFTDGEPQEWVKPYMSSANKVEDENQHPNTDRSESKEGKEAEISRL